MDEGVFASNAGMEGAAPTLEDLQQISQYWKVVNRLLPAPAAMRMNPSTWMEIKSRIQLSTIEYRTVPLMELQVQESISVRYGTVEILDKDGKLLETIVLWK